VRPIAILALSLTAACTGVSQVRSDTLWVQVEGADGLRLESDEVHAATPAHELMVKDGRAWLDDRDHGPNEEGDHVRLRRSATLLVNGERRHGVE
jgi:hypothetical protein